MSYSHRNMPIHKRPGSSDKSLPPGVVHIRRDTTRAAECEGEELCSRVRLASTASGSAGGFFVPRKGHEQGPDVTRTRASASYTFSRIRRLFFVPFRSDFSVVPKFTCDWTRAARVVLLRRILFTDRLFSSSSSTPPPLPRHNEASSFSFCRKICTLLQRIKHRGNVRSNVQNVKHRTQKRQCPWTGRASESRGSSPRLVSPNVHRRRTTIPPVPDRWINRDHFPADNHRFVLSVWGHHISRRTR